MKRFDESHKSAVQREMLAVAQTLADKAVALKRFAEGFDEIDDDDFMSHLGDQHAGPSAFRQWSKEVSDAVTMRASQTAGFEAAMSDAFAEAQRESATAKAEEKADRQAAREAAQA